MKTKQTYLYILIPMLVITGVNVVLAILSGNIHSFGGWVVSFVCWALLPDEWLKIKT